MNTYAILRRNGWRPPRSRGRRDALQEGRRQQMSDDVRWIRSYVLAEADGTLGTVCIYQATDPEAIRSTRTSPSSALGEILPVVDTVIVRPDPSK